MKAQWQDLQDLAKRSSSEERAVLLRRLADMLLRGGIADSATIIAIFEDVVCRVLDQVDQVARVEFSERVGPTAATPRRVVFQLANDVAAVAEPVLRYSPLLSQADLLDIAKNTGPAHLEIISRRIFLSDKLTDVLVARGRKMVHRTLAANDGAQISAGAYTVLLNIAPSDTVLQELMALRPSLPAPVREKLLPILAVEVRRRLMTRLEETPILQDKGKVQSDVISVIDRVDDNDQEQSGIVNLQASIDEGVLTLDEAVRQACRLNRHDWLIELISSVSNNERATVLTVLLMRESRPLTIMLRALNISGESFRAVLDMRARHLRVGSNDPRLVVEYDSIRPEAAIAILKKHHGNPMLVPSRA